MAEPFSSLHTAWQFYMRDIQRGQAPDQTTHQVLPHTHNTFYTNWVRKLLTATKKVVCECEALIHPERLSLMRIYVTLQSEATKARRQWPLSHTLLILQIILKAKIHLFIAVDILDRKSPLWTRLSPCLLCRCDVLSLRKITNKTYRGREFKTQIIPIETNWKTFAILSQCDIGHYWSPLIQSDEINPIFKSLQNVKSVFISLPNA